VTTTSRGAPPDSVLPDVLVETAGDAGIAVVADAHQRAREPRRAALARVGVAVAQRHHQLAQREEFM
jgi:hypothetical protein